MFQETWPCDQVQPLIGNQSLHFLLKRRAHKNPAMVPPHPSFTNSKESPEGFGSIIKNKFHKVRRCLSKFLWKFWNCWNNLIKYTKVIDKYGNYLISRTSKPSMHPDVTPKEINERTDTQLQTLWERSYQAGSRRSELPYKGFMSHPTLYSSTYSPLQKSASDLSNSDFITSSAVFLN